MATQPTTPPPEAPPQPSHPAQPEPAPPGVSPPGEDIDVPAPQPGGDPTGAPAQPVD